MSDPRPVIRAIAHARDSNSTTDQRARRRRTAEQAEHDEGTTAQAKRQRGGGGAMAFGAEEDTPRRAIRAFAHMTTASTASTDTRRQNHAARNRRAAAASTVSSSKTPADPRRAIKNFLKVADTETTGRRSSEGRFSAGDYSPGSEVLSEASSESSDENKQSISEEAPLRVLQRRRGRPPKGMESKAEGRIAPRQPGEIPYKIISQQFKDFLAALPRPNRVSVYGLEEAHSSLTAYIDRTVRDYARLARLEDAAPHVLTRTRLEYLLREQGLLTKPLGDEVRRLLDAEDARVALELPLSRARLERLE